MILKFESITGEVNKLLLYRKVLKDDIVSSVIELMKNHENMDDNEIIEISFSIYSKLITQAENQHYSGDLWKNHVLNLIVVDENSFSLAAEKIKIDKDSSIYKAALKDFKILKDLYNLNIYEFLGIDDESCIAKDYVGTLSFDNLQPLRQLFEERDTETEVVDYVAGYYNTNGSGILSKNYAFRYDEKSGLVGISNIDSITFDEIIGYDEQKKELIDNTKAFIQGKPANNVLLYGDRGTGKSSSIKAMINEFGKKGLRLIELNRYQLKYFNDVVDIIKERGLYFIIFMDDLSFEDFETDYKYLKSVIEGGIEAKPSNVLVYATSNRKHLIKETWKDREGITDEISAGEAMQEKLSLVDRFGITIMYAAPNQQEYLDIVEGIIKGKDIEMPMEDIKKEALKWQMWHNGRSGRAAKNFVNNLLAGDKVEQ